MAKNKSATRVREQLPSANSIRASLPGLSDPDSPAFERDEVYLARNSYWNLLDDLLGGTAVMRLAGSMWLPKEAKETSTSYSARLNRSFLLNGYKDALSKSTSRPFSKPVTITGEDSLPELLKPAITDIDLQGSNPTTFASELFWEAQHRGAVHILVDFPKLAPGATLRDQQVVGARPYMRLISLRDMLGWKTETAPNGKEELTEIRFLEYYESTDGRYGATNIYRIRVIRKDAFEIYELTADGENWALNEELSGIHSLGQIPIVTCYLNSTGLMTAEPVFMDLGWLNLAHWQSNSDQRNILRFARVGLYYAKGFTEKEASNIVIGPNQVISSQAENSDFKVVEYTGNSIEAGTKDLKDLEEQMQLLGMRPLLERTGNITATAVANDAGNSQNLIQHWIRIIENALVQAFQLGAKWVKQELPEDFKIDIFNDFGVSSRVTSDIDALIKARRDKEISRETFLRELKRRGLISETIDVADEIGRIEAEGPDLTGGLNFEPDDEE